MTSFMETANAFAGGTPSPEHVRLPAELIARGSTSGPKGRRGSP